MCFFVCECLHVWKDGYVVLSFVSAFMSYAFMKYVQVGELCCRGFCEGIWIALAFSHNRVYSQRSQIIGREFAKLKRANA